MFSLILFFIKGATKKVFEQRLTQKNFRNEFFFLFEANFFKLGFKTRRRFNKHVIACKFKLLTTPPFVNQLFAVITLKSKLSIR